MPNLLTNKPLTFLISTLVFSILVLIATIAVNLTVANEPLNDYGEGFGWIMFTPAPGIGVTWCAVDLAVYYIWSYHPIHWLVHTVIMGSFAFSFGICGILFYAWDYDGSWAGGMIILILGIFYFIWMYFAAVAVHRWRVEKAVKDQKTSTYIEMDPEHV